MPQPPVLVGDLFEACELARQDYLDGKITMKEYLFKIRDILK